MELRIAIKGRRSVRSYQHIPVEREQILELLDMAAWAPSAGNLQDWFVYYVEDEETKWKLARAAYNQKFVAEAPVVLVICADLQRAQHYGERGVTLYAIQDTAAFTYAFMLLAHEAGLGTCWVGAFNEEWVRTILDIPPYLRPVAIVPVGIPRRVPEAPPREPVRVMFI